MLQSGRLFGAGALRAIGQGHDEADVHIPGLMSRLTSAWLKATKIAGFSPCRVASAVTNQTCNPLQEQLWQDSNRSRSASLQTERRLRSEPCAEDACQGVDVGWFNHAVVISWR